MNIIAKNAASKLFVAFVAAAMLFTLATPVKAATVEELQAQIAALMAQISGMGSSTSSAACTFTRPLTVGSEGADVKCLQDALTPTYFNNAGGSTGYFGPVTASAVAAWQSANGISPAAGYFGPISQAKFAATVSTPDSDDSDDEDDNDSSDLSGEASLDTLEVSDGEDADEVEEGSEDAQIAEIEVVFEDGDALITRIDLALEVAAGNNGDDDPWEVFEEISLWVDGDEVARMDASDEDEYLDEDDGSLRFSGLDIRADEDEDVTIVVAATVQSSVDGVAENDDEDWFVAVGGIRFIDGDGVTTTETSGGDITDITDATISTDPKAAEFSIEVEGAGDELELKSSNEDPDSMTIALDEDDNTEEMIFAFDLSAEDSDGDIELNEVNVEVFTSNMVNNLVNDFRIEIDGESFDAEPYTGTGSSTVLRFDIDGDFTIEAEEEVTVMVYADFENLDEDYEGATIRATTSAAGIEAEGRDDITVGGSTNVNGDTHTLRTQGIDVDRVSRSAQSFNIDGSDNDYGEYEMEVDVTAFGDDLYIANTGTGAFTFQIEDASGNIVATGTATSSTITSDADVESGYYRIDEGETETFTLRVTYDPLAAGEGQDYRVQFLTIIFNDEANTTTQSTETLTPASTFETQYARIAD